MRNGNLLPNGWKHSAIFGDLFNDFNTLLAAAPERRVLEARALNRLGATDIVESEKAFHLQIDLPGFTKEQIKVEVIADRLTIRAEKSEESEKSEKAFHLRERGYDAFERRFNLGDRARYDGITAKYENGVLLLEIPKKELAQQQIIPIG